jgi:hypothetical protein
MGCDGLEQEGPREERRAWVLCSAQQYSTAVGTRVILGPAAGVGEYVGLSTYSCACVIVCRGPSSCLLRQFRWHVSICAFRMHGTYECLNELDEFGIRNG